MLSLNVYIFCHIKLWRVRPLNAMLVQILAIALCLCLSRVGDPLKQLVFFRVDASFDMSYTLL